MKKSELERIDQLLDKHKIEPHSEDLYQRIMDDVFKNTALLLLFGIFTMLVGLLIITYHNIWVVDWVVLITIVGWLSLIKGVCFIAFPKALENLAKSVFDGVVGKAVPYTSLVLGLILAYFGFF